MDLLDSGNRAALHQRLRDQVEAGGLHGATEEVEALIAESRDAQLVEAASVGRADLDWVGVCAEAIEADVRLAGLGQVGVRSTFLELGNFAGSRLDVVRYYWGPTSVEPGKGAWLGAGHGLGRDVMRVTGLDRLAELQVARPPWPSTPDQMAVHQRRGALAGLLLVLRYLGAVERHASDRGLPVPTRLEGKVESVGGEAAIAQIGPNLAMRIPCAVRPIDDDVVTRLEERHAQHVAEWHQQTDELVVKMRGKFAADGFVPAFMLPDELGETKERMVGLERLLAHLDPWNLLTRRKFEALVTRVRDVRAATAPAPIDPAPYTIL